MPANEDLPADAVAASPVPFVVTHPCPECHGRGMVDGQACPGCHGTGVGRFFHGTKADLKPGDRIGPAPQLRQVGPNDDLRLSDGHPRCGDLGSGAGTRRRSRQDLRRGADGPDRERPQSDGQKVPWQSDEVIPLAGAAAGDGRGHRLAGASSGAARSDEGRGPAGEGAGGSSRSTTETEIDVKTRPLATPSRLFATLAIAAPARLVTARK